jgi:hypothetical protein
VEPEPPCDFVVGQRYEDLVFRGLVVRRMVAFGEWSFGEWSPPEIGRSENGHSEIGRLEIGRLEIGRSENGRSENGRCTYLSHLVPFFHKCHLTHKRLNMLQVKQYKLSVKRFLQYTS